MGAIQPIRRLAGKALGHMLDIILKGFFKVSGTWTLASPRCQTVGALGCLSGSVSLAVGA
jgi:hypothetical protein